MVDVFGPAATGDETSLTLTRGDIGLDPVAVRRRGHRTNMGIWVKRIANGQRRHHRGHCVNHLTVAAGGREHARAVVAGLPVIEQRGHRQPLQEDVEIGIVEQDRGGLAAKLQRDRTKQFTARCRDLAAGCGRSGERHLVNAGMGDKIGADRTVRGHPVEHACGYACLQRGFGQDIAVENRARRRLDDQRATGGHGRCDLAQRQGDGEIPRDDRRDNANRRAFDDRLLAHLRGTNVFGPHRFCQSGIIIEHADGELALEQPAQRNWHAVLQTDRAGEVRAAGGKRGHEAAHDRRPVGRRHGRPSRMVERLARRRDRPVNVRLNRLRHGRDDFFSRCADQCDRLRRGRSHPLIADEKGVAIVDHVSLLVCRAHSHRRNSQFERRRSRHRAVDAVTSSTSVRIQASTFRCRAKLVTS